MDEPHLYQKISEAVRLAILEGSFKPGDRLPSVREMAARWECTTGTVQHAYRELVRQGLVISRPGQGTRVADAPGLQGDTALRRAGLVHRAEAFLLEALTAGHRLEEVEQALRNAMDRWRAVENRPQAPEERRLQFSGSHDLALAWLGGRFAEIAPGYSLEMRFSGSLRGLIDLAEGRADLAGSHLWDEETGEYNRPFIRRLFPGKRIALVLLAHRRLGLIFPEGNPDGIAGLEDLLRPELRFANRQEGSGTRVWLDAKLRLAGLSPERIQGYRDGLPTHSAVAQAVAEGRAGCGIGLEAAARSYALGFLPLALEPYELVAPETTMGSPAIQALVDWLGGAPARRLLEGLGGYDPGESGRVSWVSA